MARAKALKTILLEKISRERQRRRQLRRNMVTLVLMRKRFIVRLCLLTCLLLQSSEDEISARRPRSCCRSHKNTGWWELIWASYDEGRFKKTFRVSRNTFNLILKSLRPDIEKDWQRKAGLGLGLGWLPIHHCGTVWPWCDDRSQNHRGSMWSDHKKPVETFGASAFSDHQTKYYGENGGYDSVLAIPLLLGCSRWVPHPHSVPSWRSESL